MNKLINERSKYLLQHAQNPVHWWPWCEEAFIIAKEQSKPIIVSIGYATCHWCHVMERESFENGDIAAIMNEHFVCIKVDREERPDIDQYYMDGVQILQRQGGWPLNCFVTYEKKLFYGGTYYPPIPNHGRPSWGQVLLNIKQAYHERRDIVFEQSNKLHHAIHSNTLSYVNNNLSFSPDENEKISQISEINEAELLNNLNKYGDFEYGGFGSGQKFPNTMALSLLYLLGLKLKDTNSLLHVTNTLKKMASGGINDHLSGGWCRYTVDREWKIPHFEKMLYDNALILGLLSYLFALDKDEDFHLLAVKTVGFLKAELKDDSNLFWSAIDADSEGVEGKFYTWGYTELKNLLGEEFTNFEQDFMVAPQGNWDHTNILFLKNIDNSKSNISPVYLRNKSSLDILQSNRNTRIRPITDDKIIVGQNALLASELYKCYLSTEFYEAKSMADLIVDELLKHYENDGSLCHVIYDGKQDTRFTSISSDYAYFIMSLIWRYRIDFDEKYLIKANELMQYCIKNYYEPNLGYFYMSSHEGHNSSVQESQLDVLDMTMPSGNAMFLECLLFLEIVFVKLNYEDISSRMISNIKTTVEKQIFSMAYWGQILLKNESFLELKTNFRPSISELHLFHKKNIVSKAYWLYLDDDSKISTIKAEFYDNKAEKMYFLCCNNVCFAPVFDLETVFELIKNNNN